MLPALTWFSKVAVYRRGNRGRRDRLNAQAIEMLF
jgi:hypothetical protein